MTSTSRGWPLGTRPAGTPIGTLLTGTIKVMCLGDSITVGFGTAAGDSYRCLLAARALAYGLTLDFIGARADGVCADNQHNGVSGWTIAQQNADVPTRFGVLPDVILIHLGTNNFIAGDDGLAAMATFLTTLYGLAPLARVGICVPHGSSVVAQDALARTFEAGIDATCAASSYGTDSLILTCPQAAKLSHPVNAVITAQGQLQDYVHPRDPAGFKHLADAIWPVFLNLTGRAADW